MTGSTDPLNGFVPTVAEGETANLVAFIVTMISLGATVLVLLAALIVFADPRTRHHFNRSSTRMLMTCVLLTIPFTVGYAITCLEVARRKQSVCAVSMWWLLAAYNANNFLQSCICINLVLALYKPDIFRYRLQRWYYSISIGLAVIMATIPLFFNVYRFSPSKYSCWLYSNTTSSLGDPWQTAIIEVPIFIITLLMIAAITAIIIKFKQQKSEAVKELMLNQLYEPAQDFDLAGLSNNADGLAGRFEVTEQTFVIDPHKLSGSAYVTPHHTRDKRLSSVSAGSSSKLGPSSPRRGTPSFLSTSSSLSGTKNRARLTLENISEEPVRRTLKVARLPMAPNLGIDPTRETSKEVRHTIVRIAVYPIVHFLVVMVGLCSSLLLSGSTTHSRQYQYNLFIAQFFGSSWIPLAYVSCAVFADNAIWLGLQEWWYLRHLDDDADLERALGRNAHLKANSATTTDTAPSGPTTPNALDLHHPPPTTTKTARDPDDDHHPAKHWWSWLYPKNLALFGPKPSSGPRGTTGARPVDFGLEGGESLVELTEYHPADLPLPPHPLPTTQHHADNSTDHSVHLSVTHHPTDPPKPKRKHPPPPPITRIARGDGVVEDEGVGAESPLDVVDFLAADGLDPRDQRRRIDVDPIDLDPPQDGPSSQQQQQQTTKVRPVSIFTQRPISKHA